jgi:hypothetical protein
MSSPDPPACESEIPAAVALIARREKLIIDASNPPASRSPACAKPSISKKTLINGGALILVAAVPVRDFPQSSLLA